MLNFNFSCLQVHADVCDCIELLTPRPHWQVTVCPDAFIESVFIICGILQSV